MQGNRADCFMMVFRSADTLKQRVRGLKKNIHNFISERAPWHVELALVPPSSVTSRASHILCELNMLLQAGLHYDILCWAGLF